MRRAFLWFAGLALALAALVTAAAFFVDEPLRQWMERRLNDRLKGYTARVHALDFHPLGLAIELDDTTIVQQANPDPPVADLAVVTASVQWRAILSGRLVADVRFDRPAIHVNLKHLQQEARDDVPVEDRGWQEALEALYPLKINELVVHDGDVTYIDSDPRRPLRLRKVSFRAENIRNIRSPDRSYPSDLHLSAQIFDTGTLEMDGHADFLATPHVGVNTAFRATKVDLRHFEPVIERYGAALRSGTLAAEGTIEYSPSVKTGRLRTVTVRDLDIEYANRPREAEAAKDLAAKTAETAEEVANEPGLLLRVDRLDVVGGTVRFRDVQADPSYAVFLSQVNLDVRDLSNQQSEGTATSALTGRFMGSGDARVTAAFRPTRRGPDFDVSVQIEHTDLRTMNDLFRAYGSFDVAGGAFGLYAQIAVKDRQIDGYVKPLFQDVDVYERRQDRDKGALRKMYEGVVGSVAGLLENRPRDEVATKVTLSGPASDPHASTWQIVVGLVQNAFFKAILPGFERQAGAGSARRPAGG